MFYSKLYVSTRLLFIKFFMKELYEYYKVSVHEIGHFIIFEYYFPNSTEKIEISTEQVTDQWCRDGESYFKERGYVKAKLVYVEDYNSLLHQIHINLAGVMAESLLFGSYLYLRNNYFNKSDKNDLDGIDIIREQLKEKHLISDEVYHNFNDFIEEQKKIVCSILYKNLTLIKMLSYKLMIIRFLSGDTARLYLNKYKPSNKDIEFTILK